MLEYRQIQEVSLINSQEISMSAAEALLAQNTHSVTFMSALPALHRAVVANEDYKNIFLVSLHFWLTFKGKRQPGREPPARVVLEMLACAERLAVTEEERNALEVIAAGWESFAPAEYLLGCM